MKGLIRDVFDALFKIKVDDLKGWEDTHLTDTMCERIKECLPEGIDVRHTHISGSSFYGKGFYPDIVVEKDSIKIAIEIKLINKFQNPAPTRQIAAGIGQCLVYTWCGYDSAFLFVIDHCGVLKRENPELLFEKFLWHHHKIKVVIRKFPHY